MEALALAMLTAVVTASKNLVILSLALSASIAAAASALDSPPFSTVVTPSPNVISTTASASDIDEMKLFMEALTASNVLEGMEPDTSSRK